jgi:ADP-heptose:LPS heptosyltransferase
LQYGDTSADRAAAREECGVDIVHFEDQDNFADIDGLAALISACDLVITVSNTTAHLAGALGVPAMVMIPAGIGQTWYWFADSAASPWYPSLTLYRQKVAGDWPSLLKQVGKALRDYSRSARAER